MSLPAPYDPPKKSKNKNEIKNKKKYKSNLSCLYILSSMAKLCGLPLK